MTLNESIEKIKELLDDNDKKDPTFKLIILFMNLRTFLMFLLKIFKDN